MRHSILLTNRNRGDNLALCLGSIHASAAHHGLEDYEVIVAHDRPEGAGQEIANGRHERHLFVDGTPAVHLAPMEASPFWKTRLYNVAQDASTGEVITFLDADAIVGRNFMVAQLALDDRRITRVAYRVRYVLPVCHEWSESQWKAAWSNYDNYRKSFESYGAPDLVGCGPSEGPEVFGNSQWSVRRADLEPLRHDEQYIGRGYEDLSLIRAFWMKMGPRYNCVLMDREWAMFHIQHSYSPGFGADRWNQANQRRYYGRGF